jgi:hypothetical protein
MRRETARERLQWIAFVGGLFMECVALESGLVGCKWLFMSSLTLTMLSIAYLGFTSVTRWDEIERIARAKGGDK